MHLNTLKPVKGARKKETRVGRGGSRGKTCGRGHKGQQSRSGGFHKVGFEGGQMPLQRRLPKFGFNSRLSRVTQELPLYVLGKVSAEVIDLAALKAANIVNGRIRRIKVMCQGVLEQPIKVKGLMLTAGAKAAILAAGGEVIAS